MDLFAFVSCSPGFVSWPPIYAAFLCLAFILNWLNHFQFRWDGWIEQNKHLMVPLYASERHFTIVRTILGKSTDSTDHSVKVWHGASGRHQAVPLVLFPAKFVHAVPWNVVTLITLVTSYYPILWNTTYYYIILPYIMKYYIDIVITSQGIRRDLSFVIKIIHNKSNILLNGY